MLRASEYLGPVGIGATSPQLFRAHNGKLYIVKLQNNRLGPKILANEYLACRLGEIMGLCFPTGDIIYIEEDVICRHRRLINSRVKAGRHFACEYLKGSRYVDRRGLSKAINKTDLAGVMLFDHMMHNPDRTWNRRNLIIRREEGGYRIYAIDNSHLFRRGRWTVDSLQLLAGGIQINYRRSYGVLLKHFLVPENFTPYVDRAAALTDEELAAIIADIPAEWLPDQGDRQALLYFLRVRRDMVEAIAASLIRLIPNVNGSAKVN